MKIGLNTIEGRKLEFQRREANELYKKNKSYLNSKKEVLTILENLLSDEKGIDITENSNINLQPTNYEELDQEVPVHDVEEQIETLEDVRNAALASPNLTIQDLRIAIEATNQLSQLRLKSNRNNVDKSKITFELFERLKNQIFLPHEINYQSENNLEEVKVNKEFQNAIKKYRYQIEMANYNLEAETPKYSLIA